MIGRSTVDSGNLAAHLIALANADPRPDKIDVGVGVFRDDAGQTPLRGDAQPAVTASVRRWPWLLLAAVLMAAALSALLLFGAG